MPERSPRVVVVIIDGLPLDLAEDVIPELPFLGPRVPYRTSAISCFPSTTGPAYFPFLAGCTPGRANIPGIRWFDRTRPTRSSFPHRGLRSYVGPDARKLATDTLVTTLFARHAWPASSLVNLVAWIATGLGFLTLVNGLSDEPSPGLTWAIATYSVAYLLGFIVPFLPGGLGAREGALVAVVAPRFGVGAATGIALAARLAVTLGEAIAICLIWLGYLANRGLRRKASRVSSTEAPP